MKIKLLSLPFHWVHPSAPDKYLGCRVSIPVYDPDALERSEALVNAARVVSFNAAIGSVRGRPYCEPELPKSVLIPTAKLRLSWADFGRGMVLTKISMVKLGFRRFQLADLTTTPFARCPSESVDWRTIRKLERLYA